VALKMIQAGRLASDGELKRFRLEAEAAAHLDHPNIVPIYEVGEYDGRLYFTMRLVRGQSLKQILESEQREHEGWNRTRLLGVLLKACEALAYAHDKGVVHRDLKPSNIMVGRFGEVYVMDWGLARPLHAPDLHDLSLHRDLGPASTQIQSDVRGSDSGDSPGVTHDGDILGTAEYMPPEQAQSALSEIGKHSDVYSMGAVLYHLLCGQSPYQDQERRLNRLEVLARLLKGPPRAIEELAADAPPELLAICRKAMLREPHRRYATMLEFAEDLRAFLEHRVVRAYRTDAWAEVSAWIARNRALTVTASGAVLLLLVGSLVWNARLNNAIAAKESRTRERDRLDHRLRARDLIQSSDSLGAVTPDSAPKMQEWLAQSDDLLREAAVHEPDRASFVAANSTLFELFTALDDLSAVRTRVATQFVRAQTLPRRSIEQFAEAWARAIDEIAHSPLYRDKAGQALAIKPQLGLAPLGASATSGLQEFWSIDSGAAPVDRDERTGEWRVGPTTGLILVLLPGVREFTWGWPFENEHPYRLECKATLHPLFIGKHEITQGQWLHVMGDRPSFMRIDRPRTVSGAPDEPLVQFDDSYPVESVHWFDAARFALRLNLRLPFEAQWEYACRAGTTSAYWTGDDLNMLIGAENIDDSGLDLEGSPPPPAQDAFRLIAPVGSLGVNPFGLFDMHGNVSEWCRDVYHYDLGDDRLARGDGARDGFDAESASQDRMLDRVVRGGNYTRAPDTCMSADRGSIQGANWNPGTGLRVARPLWPCPWCPDGARPHE